MRELSLTEKDCRLHSIRPNRIKLVGMGLEVLNRNGILADTCSVQCINLINATEYAAGGGGPNDDRGLNG